MKRKFIVLGISGVLLTAGIVGAQQNGDAAAEPPASETESAAADMAGTQRAAMLTHLLLRRPLDMGSTLTVAFFDGDPEAGGSELSNLSFVYGEDSEAAFAEEVTTAAAEASYVTVTTSPQTETYNLADTQLAQGGRFGAVVRRSVKRILVDADPVEASGVAWARAATSLRCRNTQPRSGGAFPWSADSS